MRKSMHISTTTRHCELDPELRLFALQRLGRLGRFARDIREAHLILSLEKYRHSAEITLKLGAGEFVSRRESTDPRAAIDRAAERLERQLRRRKDKRVSRKRGGAEMFGPLPALAADGNGAGPTLGVED
jgi:putative sigma-54 modulation protein